MDNIIKNINLEDIISNQFQFSQKDSGKLHEMASAMQKFGIVDPILVRPKNGKYEIILGHDSYEAALLAGLRTIPALIKEVDDDVFNEYMMINNIGKNKIKTNKFINVSQNNNPIPQQENSSNRNNKQKNIELPNSTAPSPTLAMNNIRNNNSDIINLSELNRKEYERNDFNMNNNLMNNNLGQQSQNINTNPVAEPTFGGRFFPSLEDEPTNMNMGSISIAEPPIQNIPTMNPTQQAMSNMNNNLIDLTDIGIDKEQSISISQPNSIQPEMPQPIQDFMPNNIGMPSQPVIETGLPEINQPVSQLNTEIVNPISGPTDNIINLENLQSNVDSQMPINNLEQIPSIGNPMDINPQMVGTINNLPPIEQPQAVPQFDMSQNIAPAEFLQNQGPAQVSIPNNNIPQNDFSMPSQPIISQGLPEMNQIPEDIQNINAMSQEIPQPYSSPMPEIVQVPSKDIQPVLNTLRTIATSLEAFGYKINIMEEELLSSAKITIEVEK